MRGGHLFDIKSERGLQVLQNRLGAERGLGADRRNGRDFGLWCVKSCFITRLVTTTNGQLCGPAAPSPAMILGITSPSPRCGKARTAVAGLAGLGA
jgi:hypothetical protein